MRTSDPVQQHKSSTEPSLVRKLSRFKFGLVVSALLVGLCLPSFVAGDTRVPAGTSISNTTVWNASGSPFILEGDLAVPSGGRLVINPGVEVRMDNSSAGILVEGDLQALGTSASPVRFTSSAAERGSWRSITLVNPVAWDANAGTGSILQECIIEYGGGNNETGALILNGTSLNATNGLVVRESASACIYLSEGASVNLQNLSVSGCEIGIAATRPACSGTLSCVLQDVEVMNCTYGVALHALDSDTPQVTFQQCLFQDNDVSVQLWNISQPATFNNCNFNGSAFGIWANQSSFTVNGCSFRNQTNTSVYAVNAYQSNSSHVDLTITTSNFIGSQQGVQVENPGEAWYVLSVLGNNFVRLRGPSLHMHASAANPQARTLIQGNNFVQGRASNFTVYLAGLISNSQPVEFVKNVIAQNALGAQAISILYAEILQPASIPWQIWGNRFTQNALATSPSTNRTIYPSVIAIKVPDAESAAAVVRFNHLDNPSLDTELSLLSASSSVPCFDQEVDATRNYWGQNRTNLTTIRARVLDAMDDPHRPLAKIFPYLTGAPSGCASLEYVSPVVLPSNETNVTVTAPPLTSPTSTSAPQLTTTLPNGTVTTVVFNETTTVALNETTTEELNATTAATTVPLSSPSTFPENFTTAESVAGQGQINVSSTISTITTQSVQTTTTTEFNVTLVPTANATTTVAANATTTVAPNVTTTVAPPVLNNSVLVGEWPLSSAGNESLPDSSDNGNDAVVANFDQNAIVNNSVSDALRALRFFPQRQQLSVILPQLDLPSNGSDFSLSAWILPASAQQLDKESDTGNDGFVGQQFVVGPPNSSANASFPDNGTCALAIAAGANSVSVYCFGGLDYFAPLLVAPLKIDNWTLINVIVSNNTPSLYCNGSFVATGLSPSRNITFPSGVIGGSEYGPFEGLIAWFRADNGVLTANQTVEQFHQVFPNATVGVPVPPEEQCQSLIATGQEEEDEAPIIYVREDNSTGLRGILRGYEILRLDDSPYYLTEEVRVAPKATLVVEKGVTIIAQSAAGFSVYGAFQALGDTNDTIVFESTTLNDTADEFVACTNVQGGELFHVIAVADDFNRSECRRLCELAGYEYYGIYAGRSCSCGNSIADQWRVSSQRCNITCVDETDVTCGGEQFVSVYRTAVARHFRGLTFGCSQRYPGSSVLNHVRIVNAGSAYDAAVQVCGQAPILSNIEISNSTGKGIHHFGLIDPDVPPSLSNISISSATSDCVYFEGVSCLDGCQFFNVSCDRSLRRALYLTSTVPLTNNIAVANCSFTNCGYERQVVSLGPNVTFNTIELVNLTGAETIITGCNITDNRYHNSLYVYDARPAVEICYFARNGLDDLEQPFAIYLDSIEPNSSLRIVGNTFDSNVGAIRLSGQLYPGSIQNISHNVIRNHSGSNVVVLLPTAEHGPKAGLQFLFESNTLEDNSIEPGAALVVLDPSCCVANENYTFRVYGNRFDNNKAEDAALLWFRGDQYNETNDLISENTFSNNVALAAIELPRALNASADVPHRVPLNFNKFLNSTDTNYTIRVDELYRSAPFDATRNYWGTESESAIREKIFDYTKNPSLELVNIFPWLLSTNNTDVVPQNTPRPNCTAINNCSGHGVCVTPVVCYCDDGWTGDDCSSQNVSTTVTTTTGPVNATTTTGPANATSPTNATSVVPPLTTTATGETSTTSTRVPSSSVLSTGESTTSLESTSTSSVSTPESTSSASSATSSVTSPATSATSPTTYSTPIVQNNCALAASRCDCPQSTLNGCLEIIANDQSCVEACSSLPLRSACLDCLFSASPSCSNCACWASCVTDSSLVSQYCQGVHANCAI